MRQARHIPHHRQDLNAQRFTFRGHRQSVASLITIAMNSLRVARSALRARPVALQSAIARRGYADVASDKIRLSLALPHRVCDYNIYALRKSIAR